MTEQNEIVTPVFKNKSSNFKKQEFTACPVVKINVNEVGQLQNQFILALDITKVVIRYAC